MKTEERKVEKSMTIFDELMARGLLAQFTDEEEIKELINAGKAVFYIGFDPTADSLHVGHFMALCLMKRLQEAGNKPIALVGGGTGMIGDHGQQRRLVKGSELYRVHQGYRFLFLCQHHAQGRML